MPAESFGRKVRRLRQERARTSTAKDEWTQEGLAERIGIGQAAISRIEKDLSEPNGRTLVKLADAFGLTVERLAGGTNLAPALEVPEPEPHTPKNTNIGDLPTAEQAYAGASTGAGHRRVEGGSGGTHGGTLASEQSTDMAVFWAMLKDQSQYGQDLIRSAVFIYDLGVALTTGQARIVKADPPIGGRRGGKPDAPVSRLSQPKKSRAV